MTRGRRAASPGRRGSDPAPIPVYVLSLQKSGRTVIKNLLYRLVHGRWLDEPESIHRRQRGLLRFAADTASASEIAAAGRELVFLRAPKERLLSHCFDKVAHEVRHFPPLREFLIAHFGAKFGDQEDFGLRRRNLVSLLKSAGASLEGAAPLKCDPHWGTRAFQADRATETGLVLAPLERTTAALREVWGKAGALVAEAPPVNESSACAETLIGDEARSLIGRIHHRDFRLRKRAARRFP